MPDNSGAGSTALKSREPQGAVDQNRAPLTPAAPEHGTSALWSALTGIVAAAVVLAVAEVVAVFVGADGSPLFAVGSLAIDLAPPGVKDLMIQLFGTGDKAALLTLLGIVVLVGASLAGVLEHRRPRFGVGVLVLFSAIAVIAVTTRSGASGFAAIPTVLGMLAGAYVLTALQQRLKRWQAREAGARSRVAAYTLRAAEKAERRAGAISKPKVVPAAGSAAGSAGDGAVPASAPASSAPDAASVAAQNPADTVVAGIRPLPTPARSAQTGPNTGSTTSPTDAPPPHPAGRKPLAPLERRQFLTFAIVAAAASIVVGIGARVMNAGASAVTAARQALVLPVASTPAPPVPAGAELGLANLSPVVTPTADFYRIDTALQVPQLNPDTWALKITGMVANEVEISFAELLALPLIETHATLSCVSNEVGGDLIGNALWLGYPIRELLARAAPTAGADMVLSSSSDGFTAGTPLEVLQDADRNAILAVAMNGQALPVEHGFPVRMVVPGLYGYVSATKWVVEMKVTTFAQDMGYWTPRGWSALGPIKTESRIDTPRGNAGLAAGTIPIAGVAWSPHTGIQKVEVQIDNGSWQQATLADAISADTWRQWVLQWDAPAGDHTIAVRATDASGYTQTSDEAPPAPDGASGYHTIQVTIQ